MVRSAKFARDALDITPRLLAKLEITMGPDTSDLAVRIGMHSGQVTAGVLRGERSRFQLYVCCLVNDMFVCPVGIPLLTIHSTI